MRTQGEYRAALFLSVWAGNIVGVPFGAWLATYANEIPGWQCGLVVTAWWAATHLVWMRARRVFWPEDFKDGAPL
jgi:predicted MFS family arabinose efflux permease